MKKYICMLCSLLLLLSAKPFAAGAEAQRFEQTVLSAEYATDAFCYSFESEEEFTNSNVAVASSADNAAKNKVYAPGAGNSKAALHIRQDCSVYTNGILNSGINGVTMFPGTTYRISAWVKLLTPENYQVEPNFNFILINSGTALYTDEACTTPIAASGVFEIAVAKGSEIGFREQDGSLTGQWRRLEVLYTPDNTLGEYFIDPSAPLNCRMLLRVGSNAHTICTVSDYTDEFIASITVPVTDPETGEVTYEIDNAGFYTEYAVDDWSLEPYVEPSDVIKDASVHNDFESSGWRNASGATWTTSFSTAAPVSDSPSERHSAKNQVLQMTYTGGPYTYTDFTVTTNNTNSLLHNRAYKISFWLKASEAAVSYFEGKTRYLKLIPERAYEDRLERTKGKWAETQLLDTLSAEWQKLEYIWYEPTPHMLGRSSENNSSVRFDFRVYGLPKSDSAVTESINGTDVSYVYTYPNSAGETVYADYADFKFWLDDFTIEPLDIVANGDFAFKSAADVPASNWDTTHYLAGQNPYLPAIFGAGEITEDATVPAGKNALVLDKSDASPGQKVEIDSNTYYKISFWAKASSADSVGTGVAPLLDRSITGAKRDNAVTDSNTEGRWGYGNPTGETGDIPYYLYRGTMQTHTYDTLAVKEGEALVYDDYFARMQSCDGYETQQEPTAWNYQYYNGSQWISQNRDAVVSDWELTADWKKYECFYRWDYEGEHYRLPRLTIATESPADFRLADIRVEKYNHPTNELRLENISYQGSKNHFYAGNELRLSYDFVNEASGAKEGNSILKFLTGSADGTFAVSFMTYCRGSENLMLEVPDMEFGNRLGLEIIPVAADGRQGAVQRIYFDGIIAGRVVPELSVSDTQASFSIAASFAKNLEKSSVTAVLSMYDADNRLIKTALYPISTDEAGTVSDSIALGDAAKAKLFVLESADTLVPCCDSKTALIFPENQAPFADTDTITVAYMGGSSMAGKGIYYSEESTYRAYITEYLTDTYPDKAICALNYSKDGAKTEDGLKIAGEVAASNPDLVFIDYAPDDNRTDVRKELTEIVETLTAGEKTPYIIFLYAGDRDYTDFAKFHKEVAEQYGIPQIDLRASLKNHLLGLDAKKEGYFLDDLRPAGEGHIIYGETIIRALETGKYFHKPK